MVKKLGIIVLFFAIISLAMGVVFVQQGFSKEAYLYESMQEEKIELDGVEGIIDTAAEAR